LCGARCGTLRSRTNRQTRQSRARDDARRARSRTLLCAVRILRADHFARRRRAFDELKNQWGWAGFSAQDSKRCQTTARITAFRINKEWIVNNGLSAIIWRECACWLRLFMGRNALSKRAQQLTNAIAAPLIEKKNASACKQPVEVFHPGAQMQLLLNQTKL
jgi:hypothetical protein